MILRFNEKSVSALKYISGWEEYKCNKNFRISTSAVVMIFAAEKAEKVLTY